jgi:hypothetical protein
MLSLKLLLLIVVGGSISTSFAQTKSPCDPAKPFKGCRACGAGTPRHRTSQDPAALERNVLRNRTTSPSEINKEITLEDILRPGIDVGRWKTSDAVKLTAYVSSVGWRPPNAANCFSPTMKDIYLSIVSSPEDLGNRQRRMEAIITPRWWKKLGITTQNFPAFRTSLLHKRVALTGWLFYDSGNDKRAVNTTPNERTNWRATAWELHPVTAYRRVEPDQNLTAPATASTVASVTSPDPIPETSQSISMATFDSLPKDRQVQILSDSGPLIPDEYSMDELPMRVFVKADWKMLVAYSLRADWSARLTLNAGGATLEQTLPPGQARELVITIPPEFGSTPQVAKFSLIVTPNGNPDEEGFVLTGVGIVQKTDGHHSSIKPASRSVGSDGLPIKINTNRELISVDRPEDLTYSFVVNDKYSGGRSKIYLINLKNGRQTSSLVVQETDKPILKDTQTKEHKWNGKNPKTNQFSLGLHKIQVSVWRGVGEGAEWFGPITGPKRIRVK